MVHKLASVGLPVTGTDEATKVIFPAAFSDAIITRLQSLVPPGRILDPFAGTGRIHELASDGRRTTGVEIERELAALHRNTFLGDALNLQPLIDHEVRFPVTFDSVVTSPTYGNRFADAHNAKDDSVRRSYTHDMRRMTGDPTRKLHKNNSGTLHFGPAYLDFHRRVWVECARVLVPGGFMFLNISDFIRRGKRVPVVASHKGLLRRAGFEVLGEEQVGTPRMRYGQNHEARVDGEVVIVARKKV